MYLKSQLSKKGACAITFLLPILCLVVSLLTLPLAAAAIEEEKDATTLTTQASVSLVNNRGHLGRTLKDLGPKESLHALVACIGAVEITSGVTCINYVEIL